MQLIPSERNSICCLACPVSVEQDIGTRQSSPHHVICCSGVNCIPQPAMKASLITASWQPPLPQLKSGDSPHFENLRMSKNVAPTDPQGDYPSLQKSTTVTRIAPPSGLDPCDFKGRGMILACHGGGNPGPSCKEPEANMTKLAIFGVDGLRAEYD